MRFLHVWILHYQSWHITFMYWLHAMPRCSGAFIRGKRVMAIQEEVTGKTVALVINGGKISEKVLKDAIAKLLAELEQERRQDEQRAAEKKRKKQQKTAEKKQQKTDKKNQKKKEAASSKKQNLKKMMGQGCQLSDIEVTGENIKSFERYARKYHVGYSLKKDRSVSPPRYFVFFKAKDVDVMTAAFKEYTGWQLKKSKKPSVRKKLERAKGRLAQHRERVKEKKKERGPEL